MKFSVKDFFSKDFFSKTSVTYTEQILNLKLDFLCSERNENVLTLQLTAWIGHLCFRHTKVWLFPQNIVKRSPWCSLSKCYMAKENHFLFWYLGRNGCRDWKEADWFRLKSQHFNAISKKWFISSKNSNLKMLFWAYNIIYKITNKHGGKIKPIDAKTG